MKSELRGVTRAGSASGYGEEGLWTETKTIRQPEVKV